MTDPKPQTNRRRTWLRRAAIALAVLLAAGLVYLTRPATLAALILPRASEAIGGEVTAARISLGGLNSVVLEDLRVRTPGWEGRAGELLYSNRLEVRFSLFSLLFGEFRARAIRADRLALRLVEDGDAAGRYSFQSLTPRVADDDRPDEQRAAQRPSEIAVDELVIENLIASGGELRSLGELRFRGALVPSEQSATAFRFTLRGRPDGQGRLSIAGIEGSFDPATQAISLAVEDLLIDGRQLAVAPIAVRGWTSRLGLEGRVTHARFEYATGEKPSALLDLAGLGLNLPIDELSGNALEDAWGGFQRGARVDLDATPRMTLRTGTLRLERDEVRFEQITGELGADGGEGRVIPVPFRGSIALRVPVDSLPEFRWEERDAWFEQAARIAPFSIDLAIRDFSSSRTEDGSADTLLLPRAATKILADFQVTAWTIDVDTLLSRGAPADDGTPAPLVSRGELRLSNGSGAFDEFPYRLDDVQAVFRYENDNLTVEELTGRGAEDATVRISGRLEGLSTGAEIDLAIVCDDAPIDDQLFNSFEDAPREALGLLFDKHAAQTLAEANLLPDAAALVTQRQQLARLGEDDASKADRERLTRSIDAAPFALGGRCGFTIRVYSPAGFGQPVLVTGDVAVRDAGLIFARFPYPLRLKQGSVRVLDEAIELSGDGITAVTPAGGLFTVAGRVEIPRLPDGGRGMRPLIAVRADNDAVNPALLAAIPHSGREMPAGWPGTDLAPAGELLAALGLRGEVDLEGLIDSDDAGRERFSFDVEFSDGTASPDERGRAELDELGLPWPRDFTLTDCSATLLLTPERATIPRCVGRNGDGTVSATGFSDLEGPDREIEIELKSIPIGRAFEGFLATDPETATARFARFSPGGTIDGIIRRKVRGESTETSGSLTPQSIDLTLDGSRVHADRIAGRIAVTATGLRAESLEYRMSEGGIEDGLLRLSGPLSTTGAAPAPAGESRPETSAEPALEASITGTRVESPLVRELLAPRAKGVLDLLRARAAKGRFDARYSSGETERFEIRPRTLSVGEAGETIELSFGESDLIAGNGERVDFTIDAAISEPAADGAEQRAMEGALALTGSYTANGDSRIGAKLSLASTRLTPALRKQLPPPLDTSAAAIELTTDGRFSLDLEDIALRWPSSGSADDPDVYQLVGKALLAKARLEAGLDFDSLDAELPIRLRYEPRASKPVDFTATLDASGGRALDRDFGRSLISLATGPTGETLELAGAGDVAFGRFDLAGSIDFEADTYSARVRIADADYDVLRLGKPMAADTARSNSRLSGIIEFGGRFGEGVDATDSRNGTGKVSIRNATIASLPVAMRVLQLTQLMLPVSSAISAAEAEFRFQGDKADITRCSLSAGTIQLEGSGTLDIPTFGVGLRFFPKGTVPIVSDVIGGVTNQFFAVDVSGPLSDPKATLAALPGIQEMPTPPVERAPAKPADGPAASEKAAPERSNPDNTAPAKPDGRE